MRFHIPMIAIIFLLCSACGSGGDGSSGDADSDSTGISTYVDIREPINGSGSYSTIQPSLEISGTAFTSPGNVDCKNVFPTKLKLTWSNRSTGQTGTGGIGSFCQSTFLGLQWGSQWTITYGTIDLQLGENDIRITVTDNIGNSGTAHLSVTRNQDLVAPVIISTAPETNADDFPIYGNLQVKFSEGMLPNSLTSSRFTLQNTDTGTFVEGHVGYEKNYNKGVYSYLWNFSPYTDLNYSTIYRATINGQVEDAFGGNIMGQDFSWTFATAKNPDITPPQVARVSPTPDSSCVPPTTVLVAEFDEALDTRNINTDSFSLTDETGAAIEAATRHEGSGIFLEPQFPLLSDTGYEATLAASITDLAGNPLGQEFRWGFRTLAELGVGTWSQTSSENVPFARRGHTATWTGTEMIVLGGYGWLPSAGQFVVTNTGGSYHPTTNSWTPTNTKGATPFSEHTAVFTGSEIILWGGNTDTGARYAPDTDSWLPTSTVDAPTPRKQHLAIWTGSEMIVWGGVGISGNALDSGGRYDPSSDRWTPIASLNAPSARVGMAYVWTGDELLIWGGQDPSGTYLSNGYRYNPAIDTWTPLANATTSIHGTASAIWTGKEMLLWDGGLPATLDSNDFPTNIPTLQAYDPLGDSWRSSENLCEPYLGNQGLQLHWTGSQLFAWINNTRGGYLYDPTNDTWQPVEVLGGPASRSDATSIWAGDRFILWGGQEPGGLQDTGFVFQ